MAPHTQRLGNRFSAADSPRPFLRRDARFPQTHHRAVAAGQDPAVGAEAQPHLPPELAVAGQGQHLLAGGC